MNRKAKYNLEKDLADKFQALAIDKHNAELHLSSQGNKLVKDAGRMTDKYSTRACSDPCARLVTLRAKLRTAQCNRPCLFVCLFVSVCVCLFVGPPYYSQRAVFASPLSAFLYLLNNLISKITYSSQCCKAVEKKLS